jgi:hypothetical protein
MSALKHMMYPDNLEEVFDELTDLSLLQRHTLKERYRFMMKEYRARCRFYATVYHTMRATMTLGSLAVPALLSIQGSATGARDIVYWLTWGLSLAVTSANGITTLFKLDKHYYMLHATAEKLRSETWQYIQLSGRYSGHHGHPHRPSHSNQYVYYCTRLEKINMHRAEDEYITMGDDSHPPAAGAAMQMTKSGVLVPSPPNPASQTPGDRRESSSTVEDGDDAHVGITVQVSGTPASLQSASDNRQPLLPNASKV